MIAGSKFIKLFCMSECMLKSVMKRIYHVFNSQKAVYQCYENN